MVRRSPESEGIDGISIGLTKTERGIAPTPFEEKT
jgi:hypothetical protein